MAYMNVHHITEETRHPPSGVSKDLIIWSHVTCGIACESLKVPYNNRPGAMCKRVKKHMSLTRSPG